MQYEKIPNLFKKKTLIELANSSENKKSKSQEIQKSEIQQKDENTKIENESSEYKKEELEKKIEEKKYTEVEAKKIANDLANVDPIKSGPISPGPHVAAKTSISEIFFLLSFKADRVIFCNISRCALEANSGTTPPCFL